MVSGALLPASSIGIINVLRRRIGKVGSMAANAATASVLLSTPKNCVHLHQYQTTGRWGAWVR